MIFLGEITIPANTTKESYVTLDVHMYAGIVSSLSIVFPFGSLGLAGVQAYDGDIQIYPFNRGTWSTGNNSKLDFDFEYPLLKTDPVIEIRGYNIDDTYDHTVYLFFSVESDTNNLVLQRQIELLKDIKLLLENLNEALNADNTKKLTDAMELLYRGDS